MKRFTFCIVIAFLMIVCMLIWLGTLAKANAATASSANDFLNSIGVNTHFDQGAENLSLAYPEISYMGVRAIRDGGRNLSSLITVYQNTGAKTDLFGAAAIATTISRLETLAAAGALLASEGPNEPNNFPVTYNGQTSSNTDYTPVAEFQRDMYSAVAADNNLSVPVFNSSEAGGPEPNNVGLQFNLIPTGAGTLMPDGTQYADFANVHNYLLGGGGGLSAPIDNNAWGAADPDHVPPFDSIYSEYQNTWAKHFLGYTSAQAQTLPRVTTETGWPTTGTKGITEDLQGKLYLDVYMSQFKRGFKYTFFYVLHDTLSGTNDYGWGLLHNDYTPKLSATYIHNLTTILADNQSCVLGDLNYSISSEPATVHDLLLQKSNGTFELAVWDERLTTGSDSITVDLGQTYQTIKIYDPTVGTTPVQTISNCRLVPLTLTDHPVIIEIVS